MLSRKPNLATWQPERILLVRLSAIGDCVLTLPLAVQAKKLWPLCRLTWAVSCAAHQFLQHHPAVDEVLQVPKRWMTDAGYWFALRDELKSRRFDLVLDPQGLSKSALLGWLSGAAVRVGFDRSQARELAPWLYTHRVTRMERHVVDAFLELLRPWVGSLEQGQGQFAMPVFTEEAERVDHWLRQRGLSTVPWVGLNPGAGWSTKRWPPERFGMLARELQRTCGWPSLVFWAGDSERLLAEVAVEESEGAARLAPDCSLPELIELLRRCRMLVAGDTGPLHLASAVGTPAVSLHGPTRSDETGPYGNPHVAIQSKVAVPGRRFKRHGPAYSMHAIELSDVVRACLQLIGSPQQKAA